ncbi:nucleotide-diphospho-sugar transferase [Dacryopinax primogenitus]|uniref:Nucleotide-diphospho-sugar transferase n=1 Tax=Dacryopinax primogenitus (strain DJM 731) TaxID=1858805 RepID=M5FRP8_DACPD|nr:nucleotide-diphospho-sugar transferase [Dacryopinax primogenitus]EJT98413.1 nucleotide-diphospho-sugar transferase [Dacryopinax primogenitus]
MQCPYTAAIVYLVKESQVSNLLLSLSLLWHNVPMQCSYPIVLFHDGYFRPAYVQRAFRDKLLLLLMGRMEKDGHGVVLKMLEAINGIEFIELEPRLPRGVSSNIDVVDPVFPDVWPGYHHMCQFFFSGIFEHPRIRNLDYYLRLDTDSFIVDQVSYDPIGALFKDKKKYGFVAIATDPQFVTEGFFPFVQAFVARRPEIKTQLEKNGWKYPDSQRPFTYQNNFEVVHIPSFRTPEVMSWVNIVNRNPLLIFKYRWGDAPLRYATTHMFFDVEHDVEMFCDLPYYHQVHIPSCSYADNSTLSQTF